VLFTDAEFPELPYPGLRPDVSFLHTDTGGRALSPGGAAPWDWSLPDGTGLAGWLAAAGEPGPDERIPVLGYGSNASPGKLGWLRRHLGLTGAVPVLRAECVDLAAVWATGLRLRDGERPATLTAEPGHREFHAVWLATPEQVRVLDVCEGRGVRYRLARLDTGTVRLADDTVVDGVLAYLAADPVRLPLLVEGRPVRCADTTQAAAKALRGVPGPDHLAARTVDGDPTAGDWPPRLFVYGSLGPGGSAWPLIEPLLSGPPTPAELPATVHDPGTGYPALRFDPAERTPGWLLPLADPAAAWPRLDDYEGAEYVRTRVRLSDGVAAWVYRWHTDPTQHPRW
jgi:gamma-glutamylcyclotransferase (GGCT)/AIG2-like uncharacterized protein YtfP